MQSYEIFILIFCLAALFAYINARFIKLQQTIGIVVLSILFSLIVLLAGSFFPSLSNKFIHIVSSIDFHDLLMNGLLSFLLFAGSIHINSINLKSERLPIIAFSTVGILISTFLVGTLLYFLIFSFHLQVGYIYCLLFASLISPTDPIAVLSILKRAGIPKSLETKIAGESLFNDGVAVVIFLTILEIAQTGLERTSVSDVLIMFVRETGGGLLFGLFLGYLGYYLLRSIDQFEVEVMITVAVVMGGYLLATRLHISGPLSMVVAGIIIGNKARTMSVSEKTKEYLDKFWELVDEMLNAILFMLIGLEMLVIKTSWQIAIIGFIAIVIILFARWVSIVIPFLAIRKRVSFVKNAVAIMTWGGLRGGLSIALALSLPIEMHRNLFVSMTYMVVVFSIIIQGLTIGKLYKKLSQK